MLAALNNDEIEVPLMLLTRGASVHEVDQFGRTPLHYVVSGFGSPEMIQLLHNYGAQMNRVDHIGVSALMIASYLCDNPQTIETLLALGCDPLLVCDDGYIAYEYALQNVHLFDKQVLKELRKASNW